MSIYLDYAATSPLRPEVRALLARSYRQDWGNASSLHRPGHTARMHLEEARERIARVLGAKVEEIVFTSGATEANNLAILGWMREQPKGAHLIVSAIEHPSSWEAAEALRFEGYTVDTAPVDRQGRLDIPAMLALVRPETALVSLMAVNNEVGSVQPVAELAGLERKWKLHVDAVQSGLLGWPSLTGIDMLSLSAHKLGGPVGSGCLFLRQGLRLAPLLVGGAQEDHRRAGTSNVIAALALAEAAEVTATLRSQEQVQMLSLHEQLGSIMAKISGAVSLGGQTSPHISSWFFEGVRAEPLLVLLDLQGISVSSGSACSSHSVEPSRVVSAMGFTSEQARGLIRFSWGHSTTPEEIEKVGKCLNGLVEKARRQSGTEI